jgi:hypothetical protein
MFPVHVHQDDHHDHRAIHANGDALAEFVIMDLVTDEHTLLAVLLLICTLILPVSSRRVGPLSSNQVSPEDGTTLKSSDF